MLHSIHVCGRVLLRHRSLQQNADCSHFGSCIALKAPFEIK